MKSAAWLMPSWDNCHPVDLESYFGWCGWSPVTLHPHPKPLIQGQDHTAFLGEACTDSRAPLVEVPSNLGSTLHLALLCSSVDRVLSTNQVAFHSAPRNWPLSLSLLGMPCVLTKVSTSDRRLRQGPGGGEGCFVWNNAAVRKVHEQRAVQ